MRRRILILLPVLLLLPVALASAAPLPRSVGVYWDEYAEMGPYVEPPAWRLYLDLELRQDGQTIAQQMLDTGLGPTDAPGEGLFATMEWSWETGDWIGEAEEWARLRWDAEGVDPVYGRYVPASGETREDGRRFWLLGTVTGSGWTVYVPIIMR